MCVQVTHFWFECSFAYSSSQHLLRNHSTYNIKWTIAPFHFWEYFFCPTGKTVKVTVFGMTNWVTTCEELNKWTENVIDKEKESHEISCHLEARNKGPSEWFFEMNLVPFLREINGRSFCRVEQARSRKIGRKTLGKQEIPAENRDLNRKIVRV